MANNIIVMQAPSGFTGSVTCSQSTPPSSGQTYTPDANGFVTVDPLDVGAMMRIGFLPVPPNEGKRNNLAATVDPTATDDSSKDYAVGSEWLNVTSGNSFVCTAAAPGAATWLLTGGTATLADGKIFVGNASDKAVGVTPSGDVTISNTGVTTIGANKVTSSMLANGAGVAALLAAGLGASKAYTKAANGADPLLAGAVGDRSVLIVVTVDEAFANGDGAQPTFQIGQTGTAAKFADTTAFADKAAGTVLTFAGTLTGADDLLVTAVAGTGTTETGGISVTVLALPVS